MATIKSLQTTTAGIEQILKNPINLTAQLGELSPSSLLHNGLRELASWNANIAAEYQGSYGNKRSLQ